MIIFIVACYKSGLLQLSCNSGLKKERKQEKRAIPYWNLNQLPAKSTAEEHTGAADFPHCYVQAEAPK